MVLTTGLLSLAVALGAFETGWTTEAARYVEDHYDVPMVHDCHGLRPHHDECRSGQTRQR
jgi:hypothetical protein